MEFFIISMLNGLSYGLLLFMLSSGLTLIFSMMGVLNFAHASFYMLGAYAGYTISTVTGFWPALVLAPLVVGALGLLLLGYGKLAGWDMTPAQEKMKRGGEWAQREATTAKDYLRGLLPSATAAGIGMFLGFRRRNNVGTSEPRV